MAARRLLILMLAVIAISTLAAALIAPRPQPRDTSATTTTTGGEAATQAPVRNGRLVEKSVQAPSRQPRELRLRAGDQLELTVRSRTPGQVEVPRFGLIEDVGPDMPARFSLLLNEPGAFAVRMAPGGRPVARITVRDRTAAPPR